MAKPLKPAELAILAAGSPDRRPDDERGWKTERNRYDRLVKRQRDLEAAVQPEVCQSHLESKTLHVSDDWLQANHPQLQNLQIGSPVGMDDGRHVKRRISASTATPGGSSQVKSDEVVYTKPPADERASEQKRRKDRARRCALSRTRECPQPCSAARVHGHGHRHRQTLSRPAGARRACLTGLTTLIPLMPPTLLSMLHLMLLTEQPPVWGSLSVRCAALCRCGAQRRTA